MTVIRSFVCLRFLCLRSLIKLFHKDDAQKYYQQLSVLKKF